jgi:hypothetical protein
VSCITKYSLRRNGRQEINISSVTRLFCLYCEDVQPTLAQLFIASGGELMRYQISGRLRLVGRRLIPSAIFGQILKRLVA